MLVMASAITLLAGCATTDRVVYVQTELPLPDRPNVPTILPEELSCMADDAYFKLVERDQIQFEHIKRLEAIILTTHSD